MTKDEIKKIIKQRTSPSIFDYCYIFTQAHLKVFLKFKDRLLNLNNPLKILDLGCGYKPFKNLLEKDLKIEEYIGVDFDKENSFADIVSSTEKLPFPDNYFDAAIATEVFEHTVKLDESINELRRVSKNGAIIYISTPFMFSEHGIPHDFQRITSFKYLDLFKKDEVLLLKPTNSSLTTLFFLFNVCWELIIPLKRILFLTQIFYFLNNILGLFFDNMVKFACFLGRLVFAKKREKFNTCVENYFYRMPAGYDLIVRIKK